MTNLNPLLLKIADGLSPSSDKARMSGLVTVLITTTTISARREMSSNKTRAITILYFAAASTAIGITEERIVLGDEGLKLSDLTPLLVSRHPDATDLAAILFGSQWSVDCDMVDDPATVHLKGGEEVAVICPVSGG